MQVFIERTKESKEIEFSGPVHELLKSLHIGTEEVLVIRNGSLITEDEQLDNSDAIKLLSVISGG